MEFQYLKISVDGGIAVVTVSREKALNALNPDVLRELADAFGTLDDDTAVRAVIVTGAGEKAFVAGADIPSMVELDSIDAERLAATGHAVGSALDAMRKPVIAAVNGFALGGGCELALACDFIIASDKSKFGQPEVNLGVIPGFGGTQRLPRRVGVGRAMELVLTGDIINAEEALRIGLVNRVVPAAELMATATAIAKKIAEKAPRAVAAARKAVRRSQELHLAAANELEQSLFGSLFGTHDQQEGMRAFLEKRPAKFTGE